MLNRETYNPTEYYTYMKSSQAKDKFAQINVHLKSILEKTSPANKGIIEDDIDKINSLIEKIQKGKE